MTVTNPRHGERDVGDVQWALGPTSRKPVPDLVGDRVRDLITAGELRPGDRLPTEPELARLMGVARSSVRTGLQRLESRGLVEVNRGRGWFVSAEPERSAEDLMIDRLASEDFGVLDVLEVRIALEGLASALAAARAPRGKLDEITKLARTHHEADSNDTAELLRTDEEFHEAIVDAAGNDYLRALYGMVIPLISDWRERSFTTVEVHDRSAADHNQIAVQLRRHDEVGARLSMTTHLLGLYHGVSRGQRADPDAEETSPVPLAAYVDVEDTPLFQGSSEST
jgi:DNA-binding FadR family transcriptional regulator